MYKCINNSDNPLEDHFKNNFKTPVDAYENTNISSDQVMHQYKGGEEATMAYSDPLLCKKGNITQQQATDPSTLISGSVKSNTPIEIDENQQSTRKHVTNICPTMYHWEITLFDIILNRFDFGIQYNCSTISNGSLLTQLPPGQNGRHCTDDSLDDLREWKVFCCDWNFTEVCS